MRSFSRSCTDSGAGAFCRHSFNRIFHRTYSADSTDTGLLYRQAMSTVAQPAMIITTNCKHTNQPRGLTVSSVTSLSIRPHPAISFNIQVPSKTSQTLHGSMHFALNILPPTNQAAQTCRAFAGALGRDVNPFEVEKSLLEWVTMADEDATSTSTGNNTNRNSGGIRLPVLSISSAVLLCEATHCHRVQDHEIWVAKVTDVKKLVDGQTGNLLYQNHKFHRLGGEIDE